MTIVDAPRAVTGGVDTHLDLNVAAALDLVGGLLGVAVVEVDRPNRQARRRSGKSDPLLRREVARSEWLCRLEVRRMSKT